jgi:hypothetical protein
VYACASDAIALLLCMQCVAYALFQEGCAVRVLARLGDGLDKGGVMVVVLLCGRLCFPLSYVLSESVVRVCASGAIALLLCMRCLTPALSRGLRCEGMGMGGGGLNMVGSRLDGGHAVSKTSRMLCCTLIESLHHHCCAAARLMQPLSLARAVCSPCCEWSWWCCQVGVVWFDWCESPVLPVACVSRSPKGLTLLMRTCALFACTHVLVEL